jgi:hypothetical protein
MRTTNYVHSSNSSKDKSLLSKLFGNKMNVNKNGTILHIKSNSTDTDNLILIEAESQNKLNEIIKVTPEGDLYLKGEKYYSGESNNIQTSKGIVLGKWKIIPQDDKLLIQKEIDGVWITKQHIE